MALSAALSMAPRDLWNLFIAASNPFEVLRAMTVSNPPSDADT